MDENNKWSGTLLWESKQTDPKRKELGYIRGDLSGEISSSYFEETLSALIDVLLNQAKKFGIVELPELKIGLYYTEEAKMLQSFPETEEVLSLIEKEKEYRGW
jgi:hypothetical protein